jgi:hypothetical protein
MKKSVFIVSIILTAISASCVDDPINTNACMTTESIDTILWIAELKNSMTDCTCEQSIIKGTYNGEAVIFIALTDQVCNGIDTPTLYTCYGKEIKSFSDSPADQKDLHDNLTRDIVLYRCTA